MVRCAVVLLQKLRSTAVFSGALGDKDLGIVCSVGPDLRRFACRCRNSTLTVELRGVAQAADWQGAGFLTCQTYGIDLNTGAIRWCVCFPHSACIADSLPAASAMVGTSFSRPSSSGWASPPRRWCRWTRSGRCGRSSPRQGLTCGPRPRRSGRRFRVRLRVCWMRLVTCQSAACCYVILHFIFFAGSGFAADIRGRMLFDMHFFAGSEDAMSDAAAGPLVAVQTAETVVYALDSGERVATLRHADGKPWRKSALLPDATKHWSVCADVHLLMPAQLRWLDQPHCLSVFAALVGWRARRTSRWCFSTLTRSRRCSNGTAAARRHRWLWLPSTARCLVRHLACLLLGSCLLTPAFCLRCPAVGAGRVLNGSPPLTVVVGAATGGTSFVLPC